MIETPALPLFRPTIQYIAIDDVPAGYTSSNFTIYSITIRKVGTDELSQQFIQWSPQSLNPNPPVSNSYFLQNDSTRYYNCFSYSWFIN